MGAVLHRAHLAALTAGTPAGRSCPLVKTAFARSTIEMRPRRLTVLRSAGQVAGSARTVRNPRAVLSHV
jgi:hypothetical protein